MKISLSESEQAICKTIAKFRFENNRKSNVKNSKIGNQSNEFTDLEGFAAEFAFCKLFNCFPDFSINTRSSKNKEDENGDVLFKDKIIDVKTTKYKTGKLLAALWKDSNKNIDYFALMVGTFPDYEFKGFISKSELIQPKRLGNLGYGETYIAEQKDLILNF
jgi:hypothetical protein